MAGVILRVGAFKLSRNRNYFLVLCKAIIAQQISTKAAETITHRFENLFADIRATAERVQGKISRWNYSSTPHGLSGE